MIAMHAKPNFFIVGAPKSGTTSLHYYLSQHPDVFMSKRKEPCFLAPDFNSPIYPQTEEDYLRCFEGYEGQVRVGESTSTYLYSKLAAQRIHEYTPDAKIIAMLRNPVDLVASLHAQRLKEGNETLKQLEKALDAEPDRRQGKRIPAGFHFPKEYLLYREYGKYAEQLRRYFSEFGRTNVHVIIFDDFQRDTKGEFAKVCEFLGVSKDFKPRFTVENRAKTPRLLVLHRTWHLTLPLAHAISLWLRPIIPSRFRRLLWRVYTTPMKLNLRTRRAPIRRETRTALASYYEREISDLEILLEKDLSCWRLRNQE